MGSEARKDAWSNDGCERVGELSEVGSQSEVPGRDVPASHGSEHSHRDKTEAEPEPAWWAEACLIVRWNEPLAPQPAPSMPVSLHLKETSCRDPCSKRLCRPLSSSE